MDHNKVTADTLNSAVDFDCPFIVNEDGTISDARVNSPEIIFGNEIEDKDRKKLSFPFPGYPDWELISGYSGQDSYSGPVMHNSEFLGGMMAQDVLNNPGTYVLLAVQWDDEDTPYDETEGFFIEGWVLARLKEAYDPDTELCSICGAEHRTEELHAKYRGYDAVVCDVCFYKGFADPDAAVAFHEDRNSQGKDLLDDTV